MALYLRHREDGIQWAVWKMEEPLDVLLSLLPNTRKISCEKELLRFTSERRKMEWLSVRVLLYSMLQEDKEIVYSSEGDRKSTRLNSSHRSQSRMPSSA